MVRRYFPAVHDRLSRIDPGREDPKHPFRCRYGIFPQFCINYANGKPVECVKHLDYKNIAAGVCAVMVYGVFDSKKSHFLVLHDLKLAFEFPAGTVALYPSSLLVHSNVSIVEATSAEAALAGAGLPRGSLVWFAQAAYVVSCELGMSLKAAAEAGLERDPGDVKEAFAVQ